MYHNHVSRLFAFKLLGLFGAGSLQHTPPDHQEPTKDPPRSDQFQHAKEFSSKQMVNLMLDKGIPGLTVCVSKRGRVVWSGAFGYCDVENHVECIPEARMRIASISKPLFVATIVAPMIEQDKLDIKTSIYNYLTTEEFPKQQFNGKESDITIEQLLSHTSGIRHYDEGDLKDRPLRPIGSSGSQLLYQCDDQFNRTGFFQRDTFRSVFQALEPFKAGPLVSEPGTYNYTTYGYTLLSAVAERVHQKGATNDKSKKEQIEDYWVKVLRRDWDMTETNLDQDEPILSNRARYYMRSSPNGALVNAPYTDNSVKWAGGGLISTVKDLVKFGNALVHSFKQREASKLKRETLELLWTEREGSYGLGFATKNLDPYESSGEPRVIYHLGGALGASSALILYPESEIVVAMLANLKDVNLRKVCLDIADKFASC